MALQEKYSAVIEIINSNGGRDVVINEEGGVLNINATVPYPKDKNLAWDKIKEIGGDSPADLVADIASRAGIEHDFVVIPHHFGAHLVVGCADA